ADGALDHAFHPNVVGFVNALAAGNGRVYASLRSSVVAFDANTGATEWTSSASASNAWVWVGALAYAGGVVYAGGTFTAIGGRQRSRVAALSAATGMATSWNPGVFDPEGACDECTDATQVNALAVSGTTVYIGGAFSAVGGAVRENLAAVDS